jgi:hypothetical protein
LETCTGIGVGTGHAAVPVGRRLHGVPVASTVAASVDKSGRFEPEVSTCCGEEFGGRFLAVGSAARRRAGRHPACEARPAALCQHWLCEKVRARAPRSHTRHSERRARSRRPTGRAARSVGRPPPGTARFITGEAQEGSTGQAGAAARGPRARVGRGHPPESCSGRSSTEAPISQRTAAAASLYGAARARCPESSARLTFYTQSAPGAA